MSCTRMHENHFGCVRIGQESSHNSSDMLKSGILKKETFIMAVVAHPPLL